MEAEPPRAFTVRSAIVGAIWAVWHVDRLGQPLLFAGFALSCMLLSLGFAVLTRGSWWQRGIIAGCAHAGLNLLTALLAG